MLGVDITNTYFVRLDAFMQKVILYINVLNARMKNGVLRKIDCSIIVTQDGSRPGDRVVVSNSF